MISAIIKAPRSREYNIDVYIKPPEWSQYIAY